MGRESILNAVRAPDIFKAQCPDGDSTDQLMANLLLKELKLRRRILRTRSLSP